MGMCLEITAEKSDVPVEQEPTFDCMFTPTEDTFAVANDERPLEAYMAWVKENIANGHEAEIHLRELDEFIETWTKQGFEVTVGVI